MFKFILNIIGAYVLRNHVSLVNKAPGFIVDRIFFDFWNLPLNGSKPEVGIKIGKAGIYVKTESVNMGLYFRPLPF